MQTQTFKFRSDVEKKEDLLKEETECFTERNRGTYAGDLVSNAQ